MPRRFFSRISRRFDPKKEDAWYLKPFQFLLTHPVYYTPGRRAVSGGVALGLFVGLVPVPAQTAVAILLALALRVNLPLAAISVWVTNPLTWLPLFYFSYEIGAMLLNIQPEPMPASPSWSWLQEEIALRWRPLVYGSLLVATSVASIAYLSISSVWHIATVRRYRKRHHLRPFGSRPVPRPAPGEDSRP